MSVYFIVNVTIKNPADRSLYDKYIEAVKPIVESYGGKYIVRRELVTPVSGGWKPDRIIVIEFPAKERLDACFRSEDTGALKYYARVQWPPKLLLSSNLRQQMLVKKYERR